MDQNFFESDIVKNAEKIINNKKADIICKLIFDKVVAFILLIILSPLFIVLALLIKLEDFGPVFYRQERVTKYGRIFKIYKFRTMIQNADKIGNLVDVKSSF